jgi:hypothetical protein
MARYLPLSSVTTGKTQKSPVKQEKYDVDRYNARNGSVEIRMGLQFRGFGG